MSLDELKNIMFGFEPKIDWSKYDAIWLSKRQKASIEKLYREHVRFGIQRRYSGNNIFAFSITASLMYENWGTLYEFFTGGSGLTKRKLLCYDSRDKEDGLHVGHQKLYRILNGLKQSEWGKACNGICNRVVFVVTNDAVVLCTHDSTSSDLVMLDIVELVSKYLHDTFDIPNSKAGNYSASIPVFLVDTTTALSHLKHMLVNTNCWPYSVSRSTKLSDSKSEPILPKWADINHNKLFVWDTDDEGDRWNMVTKDGSNWDWWKFEGHIASADEVYERLFHKHIHYYTRNNKDISLIDESAYARAVLKALCDDTDFSGLLLLAMADEDTNPLDPDALKDFMERIESRFTKGTDASDEEQVEL